METTPQTESNAGNAPRLPFDAEFVKHVEEFCAAIMTAVPELHGIAIVPIWENQPEKMAAGLLHLRNTQPPYVESLLAAMRRFAAFNVDMHRDLVGQLSMYERYAAQLSANVQAQLEEINQLAEKPGTPDDTQ